MEKKAHCFAKYPFSRRTSGTKRWMVLTRSSERYTEQVESSHEILRVSSEVSTRAVDGPVLKLCPKNCQLGPLTGSANITLGG